MIDGVGDGVGVIDGGKDRGAGCGYLSLAFAPDPFLTFGEAKSEGR